MSLASVAPVIPLGKPKSRSSHFEIANVLVRLGHVARVIVNANHSNV
jgi:hypothetical protein